MAVLIPLVGLFLGAGIGGTIGTIVGGLVTVGLSLFATSQAKKPRQERQGQQMTLQMGETPRRAWLGRGWSAGYYIWGGNYDEEPNDRRFEVLRIGLCDHLMNDLEGIKVDGGPYPFEVGEDGRGGPQSAFRWDGEDHLWIYFNNGVDNEVPAEVLSATNFPTQPISADDINAGCAEVWVIYRGSDDVWSGGRPNFAFFGGGAPVYDPRLDTTVEGGSGSQRADDNETWEYSENLILLSLAYRMGVYNYGGATPQLMVGRGLTLTQALGEEGLTLAQFMSAANTADEEVEILAGGTRGRYQGGIVASSDEAYDDVLQRFADGCAGLVAPRAGRLAIIPGAAQTPHAGFSIDDLVPGEPIEISRFLAIPQRVNTVVAKFPSESLYGEASSVIRRDFDDVIADGRPHEVTLDLSTVVWPESAQRVAEVFRREGRLEWRARVTLPPRFANAEVGDWIPGDMPDFGDDGPIMFRIEESERAINQSQRVLLREVSSESYDWDAETDEEADGSAVPDENLRALLFETGAYFTLEGDNVLLLEDA